jgi:hypothetical protein
MAQAPNRRWFRYSLRTLFIVVTLFACWLGWNLNKVRQREQVLRQKNITSAGMDWATKQPRQTPPQHFPFSWRLLGEQPLHILGVHGGLSPDELKRLQALFPEAEIHVYARTSPE